MRSERTNQTFKLRLLALVMALALVWYSLNPAPRPIAGRTSRDHPQPNGYTPQARERILRAYHQRSS